MRDRGMTHNEIAAEVSRQAGVPVTRGAIASAFKRAGLAEPLKKYPELVPWVLKHEHENDYVVQMLRLLARRRRGMKLSEIQDKRLDGFLRKLEREDIVVMYDPDSKDGFYAARRVPEDEDVIRVGNDPPAASSAKSLSKSPRRPSPSRATSQRAAPLTCDECGMFHQQVRRNARGSLVGEVLVSPVRVEVGSQRYVGHLCDKHVAPVLKSLKSLEAKTGTPKR